MFEPKLSSTPMVKCQSRKRWIVLALGCVMMFGPYYCYDIPAALITQIQDYMIKNDRENYDYNFGLLYTLYSAPNIILPFFGGYLVDRFGIRICLLVFVSLMCFGQLITSTGISIKSWEIIFLGRFLFGLGGECFGVAHSALLTDWFKGKELAFSFGVTLAVTNFGTVINNLLSVALTEFAGLPFAFWFGSVCTAVSVVSVLVIIPIDLKMESTIASHNGKQIAANKPSTGSTSLTTSNSLNSSGDFFTDDDDVTDESANLITDGTNNSETIAPPTFKDVCSLSGYFWILVFCTILVYGCVLPFHNILSSFLLERDYFREQPENCQLIMSGRQDDRNVMNSHCYRESWYQPPLPYDISIQGKYYSHVIAFDVDCADPLWRDEVTVEYCAKQVIAESEASLAMSVPSILAFFTSAPVGYFIDKLGYRAAICAMAPLILIFVHLWLGLTQLNAIIALLGLGVSYITFVSVLWPSIPLVVEDRLTGLSFGIMTSVMNLSIAVFPIIVAWIYDASDYTYIPNVEWLFVFLAVIGTFVGFHLNSYDAKHGSILNRGYVAAKEEVEE